MLIRYYWLKTECLKKYIIKIPYSNNNNTKIMYNAQRMLVPSNNHKLITQNASACRQEGLY